MSIQFAIDADRRTVFVTVEGAVTLAETLAHQDELRASPGFSPDFSGLIELTGNVAPALTGEDLRVIAQMAPYRTGSRQAVVVPDDLRYGLARILQIYAQERPISLRVFRDRADAARWLGLQA